jgi:RimJ/RimL family protein N-acetyltransferase
MPPEGNDQALSAEQGLVLLTPRLRLRRWEKRDLLPYIQMNADPEVRAYFKSTQMPIEALGDIMRYEAYFDTHGYGVWAVELKETSEFIGAVGFEPYTISVGMTPVAAMSWRLLKKFWGNDYAHEASSAAIDYVFDVLKLNDIIALVPRKNLRSVRLMTRLGLEWDEASAPEIS